MTSITPDLRDGGLAEFHHSIHKGEDTDNTNHIDEELYYRMDQEDRWHGFYIDEPDQHFYYDSLNESDGKFESSAQYIPHGNWFVTTTVTRKVWD